MATATFFGARELSNSPLAVFEDVPRDKKAAAAKQKDAKAGEGLSLDDVAALPFPWEAAFVQQDLLVGRAAEGNSIADGGDGHGRDASSCGDGRGALQYCHLAFHTPVITPPSSVVLGSRLDNTSIPAGPATTAAYSGEGTGSKGLAAAPEHCRIAFHGRLVLLAGDAVDGARKASSVGEAGGALEFGAQAGQLKLFTEKCKIGVVFRVGANDGHAGSSRVEVFGKDLFKKETNMSPFVGMMLLTEVHVGGFFIYMCVCIWMGLGVFCVFMFNIRSNICHPKQPQCRPFFFRKLKEEGFKCTNVRTLVLVVRSD